LNDAAEVIVKNAELKDFLIKLNADVYLEGKFFRSFPMSFYVNKTYIDIVYNQISFTVSSGGNFVYNDYPKNTQGIGLRYKSKSSLAFEGGLMLAYGENKVSDVIRNTAAAPNRDFHFSEIVKARFSSDNLTYRTDSYFNDTNYYDLSIHQRVLSPKDKKYIISEYSFINNSDEVIDSLYAGLFFDWDIGAQGAYNRAVYDEEKNFVYILNQAIDTLPLIGAAVIEPKNMNYYGIHNNNVSELDIGIYDGFTKEEKWKALSSGIKNTFTNATDISNVIGEGPIRILPKDTCRVNFIIFTGDDFEDIYYVFEEAKDYYAKAEAGEIEIGERLSIFPNPAVNTNKLYAKFNNFKEALYRIEIINTNGEPVYSNSIFIDSSIKELRIDIDSINSGMYLFVISNSIGRYSSEIISIVK